MRADAARGGRWRGTLFWFPGVQPFDAVANPQLAIGRFLHICTFPLEFATPCAQTISVVRYHLHHPPAQTEYVGVCIPCVVGELS